MPVAGVVGVGAPHVHLGWAEAAHEGGVDLAEPDALVLGEPLNGLVDVCACGHPYYELAAAPALYAVVLGGLARVSLP